LSQTATVKPPATIRTTRPKSVNSVMPADTLALGARVFGDRWPGRRGRGLYARRPRARRLERIRAQHDRRQALRVRSGGRRRGCPLCGGGAGAAPVRGAGARPRRLAFGRFLLRAARIARPLPGLRAEGSGLAALPPLGLRERGARPRPETGR